MEAKNEHVQFIFVGATFSNSVIKMIEQQFPVYIYIFSLKPKQRISWYEEDSY
jgi:hypothetical protein